MAITEAQRAIRNTGIFSSDVPRIMAGKAVEVAMEKLGRAEDDDTPDVEEWGAEGWSLDEEIDTVEMEIGNLVEPIILDAYEKSEKTLIMERSPDTIRHSTHNWLGAHLDALNPGLNIECKSVGWYLRHTWGDGGDQVPPKVVWQVQHQMLVADVPVTHIPVCFINEYSLKCLLTNRMPPITVFKVDRDLEISDYIIKRCQPIWECIEQKQLPPAERPIDLKLIYKKDSGLAVEATDEIYSAYLQLMDATRARKEAEKMEAEPKGLLQMFMQASSFLQYKGQTIATWKCDRDGEKLDVAALAVDHPEIYQKYLKPKPGARKFLPKKIK